jgi:membrane protein implicated in regulation of membrane protease activity
MDRKTTWFGLLAAVATALSTMADVSPPWSTVARVVGAVGLALLGYYAADKVKTKP